MLRSDSLPMTNRIKEVLLGLQRKASLSVALSRRIQIIMYGADGKSNYWIKHEMGIGVNMVPLWRSRWLSHYEDIVKISRQKIDQLTTRQLKTKILEVLSDRPRTGAPPKFSEAQQAQIIALACDKPKNHGIPLPFWSMDRLAQKAIERQIVKGISAMHISRILKKKALRPHKTRYWLFPKIKDWAKFRKHVCMICTLIILGIKGLKVSGYHLVCVDEKPGIQALERKSEPMSFGKPHRLEFEYKRHGTICLKAALDISSGKILHHNMTKTNNEKDFASFMKDTIERFPNADPIVFLLDNLKTHMSASLVECIAQKINYEGDLGKKGHHGILKSMASRKEFLENKKHQIRFVFTPIHCSWLNPIENWFSKLQRHVIQRNSFGSLNEAINDIEQYINYYNQELVKVIKWKFKGYTKDMPLAA